MNEIEAPRSRKIREDICLFWPRAKADGDLPKKVEVKSRGSNRKHVPNRRCQSSYEPIQISKVCLCVLSNGGLRRDRESIDQSKLAPMAVATRNQGRQSA